MATDKEIPPKTFSEEVAAASAEAGITDAPMTSEEEAIAPTTPAVPAESSLAPPAAPADAAKAPETPKAEEAPKPPQTVPLAVHIRQREKFERELATQRQLIEQGNQRLQELVSRLTPQQPPIDRNADPLGATLQEMDGLKAEIGQTRELLSRQQDEATRRQQIAAFEAAVVNDEQTYAKQAPDYPQAIAYARDMKFREYQALGLDPREAAARVQQDAYALAQHAMQQGASPAELAYQVAMALGYRRSATPVPAAAPQQNAGTSAQEVVAMRAAGAEKSGSTGGAPVASGAMSFAELTALDNEEFAKMTSGKAWDKLMRGT